MEITAFVPELFPASGPPLLTLHFSIIHHNRRGRGDNGDTQPHAVERAAVIDVPTLILVGGETIYPFMTVLALALAEAIPNAAHHTLEGQGHEVAAEALGPVLVEFFTS